MQHCGDNNRDRQIGLYWEQQFCKMAAGYGFVFTPLQIGRATSAVATVPGLKALTLPDVAIWTAPGQHHEIKHKEPTHSGAFGLERYRFQALLDFARITQQRVFYTVHNHALSGGRDTRANDIGHWLTVNVQDLDHRYSARLGSSWVNGERVDNLTVYYWPVSLWTPLQDLWEYETAAIPFWSHPSPSRRDSRQ